jgi:hypothetical protein
VSDNSGRQPDDYARDLHEGQIVMGTLVIPSCDSSPLFQAINPALGPTTQPIHRFVEPGSTPSGRSFLLPLLPLVFALGDHMADPPLPQRPATLGIAVALVAGYLIRPFPRPPPSARHADPIERALQLGTVMALPRRQDDRERPAVPVEGEVQLGAEAAPAPSECFVAARWAAPPFSPPRPRPWPERDGLRQHADEPAPRCYPPRRSPSRPLPRRRPAPGAFGGSVPKRPSDASGRAGRSRSGADRIGRECPARGRRCAGATGCR